MQTLLKNIKKEYLTIIKKIVDSGKILDAESMIQLSIDLFKEIKIKGISSEINSEDDMLLFQYGVYNWGGEHGEHYSFDLTRQFIKHKEYEPYQLSFTLIYEPDEFRELDGDNCWSVNFDDMNEFIEHIKSTDGFKLASGKIPKTYELKFSQC